MVNGLLLRARSIF